MDYDGNMWYHGRSGTSRYKSPLPLTFFGAKTRLRNGYFSRQKSHSPPRRPSERGRCIHHVHWMADHTAARGMMPAFFGSRAGMILQGDELAAATTRRMGDDRKDVESLLAWRATVTPWITGMSTWRSEMEPWRAATEQDLETVVSSTAASLAQMSGAISTLAEQNADLLRYAADHEARISALEHHAGGRPRPRPCWPWWF